MNKDELLDKMYVCILDMQKDIKELKQDVAELKQEVATLKVRMDEYDVKLEEMEQRIMASVKDVETRLENRIDDSIGTLKYVLEKEIEQAKITIKIPENICLNEGQEKYEV